jgi:hypothetical protein
MLAPTLTLSIPLLTPEDHNQQQQFRSPCPHASSNTFLPSGHCILNSAYWMGKRMIINHILNKIYCQSNPISNMQCAFTNYTAYKDIHLRIMPPIEILLMMINMKTHSSLPHFLNIHPPFTKCTIKAVNA